MQRRFAIIFDNFDKTTINKNVGLFAQYLASQGIAVEIITNKTKDNEDISWDNPQITLRRLQTKKEWEPLDHSAFYTFIEENIDAYFAIWIYRGRKYSGKIATQAYRRNILIVLKLDSDAKISKFGQLVMRFLVPSLLRVQLKLFSLISKLPSIPSVSGYFFYDLPLQLATFILCESPEIVKQLQAYVSKDKLVLYPNAVPVTKLKKISQIKKKNLILTVGRIVPQKNFERGIDAYAMLPARLKKVWKYEIIGPVQDTVYFKSIKNKIREDGLENNITIIPGLYGKDLYKKYAESSILLMPYPKPEGTHGLEGQPNVIVDGMFFKNAVVATDVGSVSYLLDNGKAGTLVEDDIMQISEVLLSIVLSKQKREKLGALAKLRVEEYFNLERNAKQFVDLLLSRDYKQYFDDQKYDTIVGDDIKTLMYKYCDLLTNTLLPSLHYSKVKILDIGCREFFTYDYFLEKYNNKIAGIDIGDAGLAFAKEKGVITLDIHAMDSYFKKNSFDIVLSIHVFEHMYDLHKALQQCYTVLAKGGYLFFAFPMPVKSTRRGHWVTLTTEKEMIDLCKSVGFKKIYSKISPAGTFRDEQEMLGIVQKI